MSDPASILSSPASGPSEPAAEFPSPAPRAPLRALRAYFYSGWAFLVPYLAAYLLYWRLKWPVNPRPADVGAPGAGLRPPSLLWIYWTLHAINVVLAAIALISWWREPRRRAQAVPAPARDVAAGPAPPPPRSFTPAPDAASLSLRLAPWLLLALLFWIPGVYLEYPADPWEHYRRINEWSAAATIGSQTDPLKSSYFLAYSLLGRMQPPTIQIRWLDLYYAGCCLLLCWQYRRLARAVGLDEKAALLFVLVQALTLGNNLFGFCRYYGISSSIFAQLGAIALIRLAINAANGPPAIRPGPLALAMLPAAASLLAVVALNHIQGIGIAGLGLGGVIVWRLIAWRRSMVWWLAATATALSVAAVLWWPRNPALDAAYRPDRWLTAWYGFNLFAPSSPASGRTLQILGGFGLVNLLAALILLRRNHVAGWLTITPLIALCLPFVGLPFANALAQRSTAEILTFHRMFLAIPTGLALVCLGRTFLAGKWNAAEALTGGTGSRLSSFFVPSRFSLLVIGSAALTLAPAGGPSYNRFWNLLSVPPGDLRMEPIVSMAESTTLRMPDAGNPRLVSTGSIACVFGTFSPRLFPFRERAIGQPAVGALDEAIAVASSSRPTTSRIPTPVADPLAADPLAWSALVGPPPEFVSGINDFPASSTALQNPPGRRCDVFSAALIPIDPTGDYRAEWSVIQRVGADGVAYLAVAWFDAEGRLLPSNAPPPSGAGHPNGWGNGIYSYFGLMGDRVPRVWTTYRWSFGARELLAIPSGARFVRLGALLNYTETPAAVIQLTDVRLWRKSRIERVADGTFSSAVHPLIVAPPAWMMWTPSSQAGQLSGHWPPNEVAVDLAAGSELWAAAQAAGAAPGEPGILRID